MIITEQILADYSDDVETSGKPHSPELRVAIAIPTFLREAVLVDTIRQVLIQDPPADEVLVIDQTPVHEPATVQYLQSQHDAGRLKWILHSPANLPGARNRALLETKCDIIIYVDDDVVLPEGFVEAHRRNYHDASVHAVSGRIEQNWGARPTRDEWPIDLDFLYLPLNAPWPRQRVANFMGANHSVRRASMEKIGGYDENYIFNGYREDTDAALRLHRSGHFVKYDPDSWLTHLQTASGGCQSRAVVARRPEWAKSFGDHYFMCRNFFPGVTFWRFTAWKHLRKYVLTKQNMRSPWRLPRSFGSYVYSLFKATSVARGVRA